MDFPFFFRWARQRIQRAWNSEGVETWRFYLGYFRWPLALILLGLAGEKLIYYGVLPLAGVLTREIAYAEAAHGYAVGDDRSAMLSIRKALLETRDNASLWKLAAKISDHTHSAEAAYCWRQVDRLSPGSLDTQLSLAEAALANHQLDLATSALNEVSPAEQATARYQMDAGGSAQANGQQALARACFERVEASAPQDAKTLLALAAWRADSSDPADLARARDLLSGLIASGASRAKALRLLIKVDVKRGDLPAAQVASETLLASRDAVFSDRIERLDLASRKTAGTVENRLASLLQTRDPTEISAVLEWMTTHNRAEEALIWIRHQSEETQDDPLIGIGRAGCLAALGDWAHLRDDQMDSTWPGHEPERLMILAQACLRLKNEGDARAAWNEAIQACRQENDFLALLRLADRLNAPDGWTDERAEVWMALARQYPDQEWPLRSLLAYQLGRGDLLQVEMLYGRLAALEPTDPSLEANRDLACLLCGAEKEKACTDLERLEKAAPGNPAVATAAAYALYLEGRFNEALGTMGALTTAELQAPERAAYLGQLLAAAGPLDRAESCLKLALARPQLLEEERAGVERALDLVAYRRAMADLLHAPGEPARDKSIAFFSWRTSSGIAVFLMGQGVALALQGEKAESAQTLAQVEPAKLDPAELSLYEGAVLILGDDRTRAARYLELADDLSFETPSVRLNRALDGWWTLHTREPLDTSVEDGLFSVYRALAADGVDPGFWQRDAERELALTRSSLLGGHAAPAVEDRLESLLRHVPSTPEIEAQIGYALFLQGRVQAARARLEILSPADLEQPEAAFFYGTVLQACGEKTRAQNYLQRAAVVSFLSPQIALQRSKP